MSQATPNVEYLKGLSVVGVQQTDRVVEVVEETLKGEIPPLPRDRPSVVVVGDGSECCHF